MADWDNKEQVDATEDEPIELTDIISTDPDSYEEEEPVELMDIIEKDDNDSNPDIMDIIQVDSEKNENENQKFVCYVASNCGSIGLMCASCC
mgnify:CR=1 FL=1